MLFMVLKYAGAAYLLYLAYRLWTSPIRPVAELCGEVVRPRSSRLFLAGVMLTLGNPKVMIFFLALLPTVVDLQRMTFALYLQVTVAICLILSCVLSGYALAAMRAHRFFENTLALRWLNRAAGTVIAGAAMAVASR